MELSPNEDIRKSGMSFEVDPLQKLELHRKFRDLSTELQENVSVTPYSLTNEYTGIPVGTLKDGYGSRAVSLKVTNAPDSLPATEIILSAGGPGRGEQRTYAHRAPFDAWEETRPGDQKPRRIMSTAFLVDALRPQLPQGVFDMDNYPDPEDPSEIVILMSNFLAITARSHRKSTRYKASDIQVGGDLYTNIRETDFIVQTIGNRAIRALFVASLFKSSDGPLRKTYAYEVVEKNYALESVKSSLELEGPEIDGEDRISQLSLDELIQKEAIKDDPVDAPLEEQLESLPYDPFSAAYTGIDNIRRDYKLTQPKR